MNSNVNYFWSLKCLGTCFSHTQIRTPCHLICGDIYIDSYIQVLELIVEHDTLSCNAKIFLVGDRECNTFVCYCLMHYIHLNERTFFYKFSPQIKGVQPFMYEVHLWQSQKSPVYPLGWMITFDWLRGGKQNVMYRFIFIHFVIMKPLTSQVPYNPMRK